MTDTKETTASAIRVLSSWFATPSQRANAKAYLMELAAAHDERSKIVDDLTKDLQRAAVVLRSDMMNGRFRARDVFTGAEVWQMIDALKKDAGL